MRIETFTRNKDIFILINGVYVPCPELFKLAVLVGSSLQWELAYQNVFDQISRMTGVNVPRTLPQMKELNAILNQGQKQIFEIGSEVTTFRNHPSGRRGSTVTVEGYVKKVKGDDLWIIPRSIIDVEDFEATFDALSGDRYHITEIVKGWISGDDL